MDESRNHSENAVPANGPVGMTNTSGNATPSCKTSILEYKQK